jgi:ABC-type metal ion transport system substrate-binding protein
MILSILISTLSEPYVVHVVGAPSASSLWNTLLTMFASEARARVMQVYFQLATVKKGNNSITKYFQTIKMLNDTLAAAGQPLNDFESVSFLLKGLSSEYDPFVTSVTTRVDPLSFDELYSYLLAHEM